MTTEEPGESPVAGRSRSSPDPLGKRALFWMPADQSTPSHQPRTAAAPSPFGKRALYSDAAPSAGADETVVGDNPIAEQGRITVTCSVCGVASRIGVLDFVIYQLPIGYWLPRGRFGHRMTCPSCRRRVWAGVTLR